MCLPYATCTYDLDGFCSFDDRNLEISKAPLESQALGTCLFMSDDE